MNRKEIEEKLKTFPEVELSPKEQKAIKKIESRKDKSTVSLEEFKEQMEYSGNISLRVPKSLHKLLVDEAKKEGVSLNQLAVYLLSHSLKV